MDDNNFMNQPPQNNVPVSGQSDGNVNNVVSSDQYRNPWYGNRAGKALLVVGVVVVIGGLATYLGFHNSNNNSSQKPNNTIAVNDTDEAPYKYLATVKLESDTIMPSTITVQPQTDVSIENHDTVSHTINISQADNNSGGTLVLPWNGKNLTYTEGGFANNVTIVPGDGYDYVFANSGDYFYHDVNDPSINGEIIVN